MPTLDQLAQGLKAAEAAGDTDSAHTLALAYAQMRDQQAQSANPDFSDVTSSVEFAPAHPVRSAIGSVIGGGTVDALDAFQHHLMNPLHGAAQLVDHGVDSAANAALPAGNGLRRYINQTVSSDDAAMAQREADYQARIPNGIPAAIGATVGEIAPWMYGVGELRAAGVLPKVAPLADVSGIGEKAANLAAKAGLLSGEGAVMGAAQPVTGSDYWGEKGKQVGIGALAAPVMAAVINPAKNLLGGVLKYATSNGRNMLADARVAKLYGTDANMLAQLRAAPSADGFVPTPAQALATPEAVQTERILRNNPQTAPAFAKAHSNQNAALNAIVEQLSGTDADMASAHAARTAATKPYYDSLAGNPVPTGGLRDALQLLQNSSMGVRPKIGQAIGNIIGTMDQYRNPQAGNAVDAGILSGIRENIHSYLGDNPTAQEKKALAPVADYIADHIDAYVPGYRGNLAAYATASQPINDMQAARQLRDAIAASTLDAGGNQNVDLTKVRALLAKDNREKFPMSPQARSKIEGILAALQQRSVTNNNIAASGPGTAADTLRGSSSSVLQRLAAQGAGGAGAVVGSQFSPGIGTLLGYLAATGAAEGVNSANNAVMRQVGQKAASAPATADAIDAYLARKRNGGGFPSVVPVGLVPWQQRPAP